MTNTVSAEADPWAAPASPATLDPGHARRFLELLGKAPATTRLRAFPAKGSANHAAIGARKGGWDLEQAGVWNRQGRGVYCVTGNGGDKKEDITSCPALFNEWDDQPIEWQLTAWIELGLPQPSFQVLTGGRSVHSYWVFAEPISPELFEKLQILLYTHCKSDKLKDPSRVMRLPGFAYIGPDDKPAGMVELVNVTGIRYTAADFEACLPAIEAKPAPEQAPEAFRAFEVLLGGLDDDLPPRPPGALRDALSKIPPFTHGAGQRPELVGLALRLQVEVGAAEAQQLLSETCCQGISDLSGYFNSKPTKINPGSVWPYLRDVWGIDIKRHDLKGHRPKTQRNTDQGPTQEQLQQQQKANTPPPPANKVMQLAEVRKQLAAAVADGLSAADLEVERLRLAGASEQNPASLLGLLRTIEKEHEVRSAIAAEARTLRAEADRHEISQALTLDYLFPPSMAEALRVRCCYLPADAPSIALSFLTGLAGLVKLGSEVIGIKAADFRVPMNLYTAVVGVSGGKKSPLRKLSVDQPAAPLALDLARAHSRAMEDWTQQNKALPKAERTDPPEPVYVSISSTTVEALAQQLERQEGKGLSLLINRDELSGLFGSLGAYKNGRGDDEQFFLEAYDGSGFRSLRVSSPGGGRSYESCSLSIYGTVQPGVLEQLVASGDDSGLWARFLFVPLPQKVVALPESETELEIEEAAAAAAALTQACSAVYRMPRRSLELSPEARRAFVRYESNAQQEALRAAIGAQSALFGKAAGKVLRIAGLLHLLQLVAPDGQASELITADTMERATALVDHINGWTLSLHADQARGGASDLMRMVHRIATEAQQPIKWKEISGRLSCKQRKEIDPAHVAMAMEALVELGVGETERGVRGALTYRATAVLP